MARARIVQFAALLTLAVGLAALLFGLLLPARVFWEPPGHDPAHEAVRASALRVVLVWGFAWPIALVRTAARTGATRLRVLWTLGAVLLLVHIAIAFHVGHAWSHAAAWEHTRRVGGYGDGVFVNYAFALVWVADAAWAWGAFESYLQRPCWLTWAVHGFFLFIVFNAAVVFGGWAARAAFGVAFLAGGAWIANWYRR